MIKEMWRIVSGYEGLYEISNIGRVKSLSRPHKIRGGKFSMRKERILKDGIRNDGYRSLILCKNKVHNRYVTHRLVAIAFIPNPENLPEVNHKDGNKLNNLVSNLEWTDKLGNMQHAYETGLIKHDNLLKSGVLASKARQVQVNQYSLDGKFIATFGSLKEASQLTNTNKVSISLCCSGLNKTGNGFIWRKA